MGGRGDWEYRTTFAPEAGVLAQEKVLLVCDGLDTLADVTLNGQLLGSTDNMFRRYEWEVKDALREGENELFIRFASPVRFITAANAERPLRGVSQAIDGGPHLRKAPCHFGWDWGPQLPPIGVWKDIRLEGRSGARFDDVHLRQAHDEGSVAVSATVAVERWSDAPVTAILRLTAPDGSGAQEIVEPVHGGFATLALAVDNPQLWWPNGYGAQPLYTVEVYLEQDGRARRRHARFQLGSAHHRTAPGAGPVGQVLHLCRQRRADLCQGRQLDSGRLLPDAARRRRPRRLAGATDP